MHHPCQFGEDRISNNLDTEHATNTLNRSVGQRRCQWYSISSPRLRLGELKMLCTCSWLILAQRYGEDEIGKSVTTPTTDNG